MHRVQQSSGLHQGVVIQRRRSGKDHGFGVFQAPGLVLEKGRHILFSNRHSLLDRLGVDPLLVVSLEFEIDVLVSGRPLPVPAYSKELCAFASRNPLLVQCPCWASRSILTRSGSPACPRACCLLTGWSSWTRGGPSFRTLRVAPHQLP